MDLRLSSGFENLAWSQVWKSKGKLSDDGYTVEVAIPFRSLKFRGSDGPQEWGLFLTRWIPATGSTYIFPKTHRSALFTPQLFAHAGKLVNVQPPKRGSGLELIPTLTVLQADSVESPGDPIDPWGFKPWHESVRPGLDVLMGLTPNTGLSVAVNPDFSQVESDDPQLSLNQRFALFRQERRQFFLAGLEAFQDQQSSLYTRSVVQPWYGVSLAGREGPALVGLLHALDRTPAASIAEEGTPGFDADDVVGADMFTTFGRTRIDAFKAGYLGVSFADKRVLQTGAANDVLGIDAQIPLPANQTLALSTLQSLTGDGTSGPVWGQRNQVQWMRATGQGVGWNVLVTDSTQDFRAETAFYPQAGFTEASGSIDYTIEPNGVIDTLTPQLTVVGRTERSGDYRGDVRVQQGAVIAGVHQVAVGVTGTTLREAGVDLDIGVVADAAWSAEPSRFVSWSVGGGGGTTYHYFHQVPSTTGQADLGLTLRPLKSLRLDTYLLGLWLNPKDLDPEWQGALRTRLGWQLSNHIGFRVIEQLEGGTGLGDGWLSSQALFSWILHPGTEAYLGYAETRALGSSSGLTDQMVFGKISGRFRL